MATVTPVDVAVNPNDTDQRYVLWSTGRIDAVGGAPSITEFHDSMATWYTRFDPPGVALHISDWNTGQGYVLDYRGGFNPINGAPTLGGVGGNELAVTGVPVSASPRDIKYVDWSWDPGGSGRCVVLDAYGELFYYNGVTEASRTGRHWTTRVAMALEVNWSGGQPTASAIFAYNGGVYGDYGTPRNVLPPRWFGWSAGRDLAITDWTNPIDGYLLNLYGGVEEFGSATQVHGEPTKRADVARCLTVLSESNPLKVWVVWSSGQSFDVISSTAPTVTAGAGTNESQQVTISGSPTGGTFQLTFEGEQTATIAHDAIASTVESALEALSNVASGDVEVTGGPGPDTPWVVTFQGAWSMTNVDEMTAVETFTGGSSPSIAVETLTEGVDSNPLSTVTETTRPVLAWDYEDVQGDDQAEWEVYVFTQAFADANDMSDPSEHDDDRVLYMTGTDPARRGAVAAFDYSNDDYRMFVRARDTSGLWSDWDSRDWTQNVTPPTAPSGLTATADAETFSVDLSASCDTGSSADTVAFGYSDDDGTTWGLVRGAEAVALTATTTATDYDVPCGITRQYRAVAYNDDPRVVSDNSGTDSATIGVHKYILTSADDPDLGGEIEVVDTPAWSREAKAGVFEGAGAQHPIVVSDGTPKARRMNLGVRADLKPAWDSLRELIESDSTLVYRDPFGTVAYCRVVGSWTREQIRAFPDSSESTPLRHMHKIVIPLVEVEQPSVLDLTDTTPPGPSD